MFSSAVIKLTAFCNLDCSYCFMFNMGDKTFERVPKNMPDDVADLLLDRISDYLQPVPDAPFRIVLHGGEPSLWPVSSFARFFDRFQAMRQRFPNLTIGLQTNGYLLRRDLLDLLVKNRIPISFSLDGPKGYNDSARFDHAGKGSYDRVMSNIAKLKADPETCDLIGGILCVANPDIPPSEFVDWAAALPHPRLDILWPIDYNYSNPPWGDGDITAYAKAPYYGRWFADVFDHWWVRDDPNLMIRHFRDIVGLHLGGRRHSDQIVNEESQLFVVNTDGRIEYPDYLRGTSDGQIATGHTLESHSIKDLERDDGFQFLFNLGKHLPESCSDCNLKDLCGGGFLAGRLVDDSPVPVGKSVLCYDHYYFLSRARARIKTAMTKAA